MAINVSQGFIIGNNEPVDSRFIVASQAARLAIRTSLAYEGLIVYQQDTNELYVLINHVAPSEVASWVQLAEDTGVSGLTAVATDSSISGDGTSGSVLSVVDSEIEIEAS